MGYSVLIRNFIRIAFAKVIIDLLYYPWRMIEKAFRKDLGAKTKSHYYIMLCFRFFSESFYVTITYWTRIQNKKHYVKLRLDLTQNNHLWYFRLRDKYEFSWIRMIADAMNDATQFIDIGSNIGVFAITIAKAFPQKKIIAIEPLVENCAFLKHNVELNNISNIEIINAAVLNSSEMVKFYPNPIHDGGGSIINTGVYRTGSVCLDANTYRLKNRKFLPEVEVKAIKLDDIIRCKSVIKIDVEGAEISVIESGSSIAKNNLVDVMVIEVLDKTIADVVSLLDNFGFDAFKEGDMSRLDSNSQLSWFVGNILCLKRQTKAYEKFPKKYCKSGHE